MDEMLKNSKLIVPAVFEPDDIDFFALALKLDCPIWPNDKKLKEQSKVRVFATKELVEL